MLFGTSLAAHAVLIAWLRDAFRVGRAGTLLLVAMGVVLSLALFAPREYFGVTSFEVAVVALGASSFVGMRIALAAIGYVTAARSGARSRGTKTVQPARASEASA